MRGLLAVLLLTVTLSGCGGDDAVPASKDQCAKAIDLVEAHLVALTLAMMSLASDNGPGAEAATDAVDDVGRKAKKAGAKNTVDLLKQECLG